METKVKFYTKKNECDSQEGISPNQIIYNGIALTDYRTIQIHGFDLKKFNKAFMLSGINPSIHDELNCIIWIEQSLAEKESERILLSILENNHHHEGIKSWLINFGLSQKAYNERCIWEQKYKESTNENAKLIFSHKEKRFIQV